MCDESKLAEWAKQTISRRQFGALTGAAAVVACAPGEAVNGAGAAPLPLAERGVTFATADGTMDGLLVQPAKGKHPAVILWPDIASIRESKRNIARKLASEGYAVGNTGTIAAWNGSIWNSQASPVASRLRAVAMAPAGASPGSRSAAT